MGDALVHSYHFVSAALSSSQCSSCSNVASLQWGTVLHQVLQNALEHKSQVLPMDWSSSWIAPAWVLPKSIQSCRNRLLLWVPHRHCSAQSLLLHGLLSIGCSSCQKLLLWALHRLQFLSEHIHLPCHGILQCCGAISTSVPGNTSPYSFSDLAVCRVVSFTGFSLLSQLLHTGLYPLVDALAQRCHQHGWLAFASAGALLELA